MSRHLLVLALVALLCCLSLSACLQLGLPGDSGTAGAGASGGTSGSGGATAAVTGAHCGADPSSGVMLCLGISSCPNVAVDPDQLPGCGYRISGSTLDLECVCGDYLCPLGPAPTCSDAQALLADQTMSGACAAVSDGRCTALPSNTSTSTKTGTSSTCDASCRSDCDGEPTCVEACGC